MKILCIHQNIPGQYLHLVQHLRSLGGNEVVGIGEADNIKRRGSIYGITSVGYPKPQGAGEQTHHYLQSTEAEVRRGQAVVRTVFGLKRKGFVPDVICAHPGWGEALFLRDMFPTTPLLMFAEFFFRAGEANLQFDPEFMLSADWGFSVRIRNATQLISLATANLCHSPTRWQASRYPHFIRERMQVLHEGIDTTYMHPDAQAQIEIQPLKTPGESRVLKVPGAGATRTLAVPEELRTEARGEPFVFGPQQKIVTYVSRNLEPYRGFHIFMRSLPLIQREHPDAHILIVGGEGSSYSPALPQGTTYKQKYMEEMDGKIDLSRVHFLGKIPYKALHALFCISSVHVYLTYPFVLSWSVLEAMSCEGLIVGSRTAPVEEVITHGENGLLVDFFDTEALAGQVNDILSNPHAYEAVRRAARRTIMEKYELATCLKKQTALLYDLVAGKYPLAD